MRYLYTFIVSTLLSVKLLAQGEIVAPNNLRWQSNVQGTATVNISSTQPRYGYGNVGDMSLELHTTGQMSDWAFYTRTVLPGESWGKLTELTTLSFDWLRITSPNWNASQTTSGIPLYDWQYKSPVFRVLLSNNAELVWENYFNRPINGDVSYINSWQSEHILLGNFWYRNNNLYSSTAGNCSLDQLGVWTGLHQVVSINEAVSCFGDATVVGVSVGVGSQWPFEYNGFVDNVRVGFNNTTVVNANFDQISTIPEPSSYVLMITVLLTLLTIRYYKTRA